jgi:hypothetical protein
MKGRGPQTVSVATVAAARGPAKFKGLVTHELVTKGICAAMQVCCFLG